MLRTPALRILLLTALSLGTVDTPLAAGGPELRQIFVTSTTGTGDLATWAGSGGFGGVLGANNVCQSLAEAAGLADPGTHDPVFHAWISTSSTDAYCNVQGLGGKRPSCNGGTPVGGPWVRTDGLLFVDDLIQLANSPTFAYVPLRLDENGADVTTNTLFHTGTLIDGTRSTNDCLGFISVSGDVQSGSVNATRLWSFVPTLSTCLTPQRLACLEVGPGLPVRKPSAPGYLAFVTSAVGPGVFGDWAQAGGATGLEAGDASCAVLAAGAGLPAPDSFRVWASNNANDAICHVRGLAGLASSSCEGATPPPEAPFRRVDGFEIASSVADLLDGELATSLSANELGGLTSGGAFTGTLSNGTISPNATCNGWLDSAGFVATPGALTGLTTWTQNGQATCSGSAHIYCFSSVITIFWDGFESAGLGAWSAVVPN